MEIKCDPQLFHLLGITEAVELFFNSINLRNRRKGNYHEITIIILLLLLEDIHSGIFNCDQIGSIKRRERPAYIKGMEHGARTQPASRIP